MKSRTFLFTLVLFLFFFNAGILVISNHTFQKGLDGAKDQGLAEHYFLSASIAKDLNALYSRDVATEETNTTLFQSYAGYYQKQNGFFAVYRGDTLLFSNLPSGAPSEKPPDIKENQRMVTIKTAQDRQYLQIFGMLPAPMGEYSLFYLSDQTQFVKTWHETAFTVIWVGALLSLLLAVCLLLLLNRIFKPLQEVSRAARELSGGSYKNRIAVRGKGEAAQMADNFNHMADVIEEKIYALDQAAKQKQQFIDNLAHELRTPLTTIQGYAQYMQSAALSEEEQAQCTDYILSASQRMQSMSSRLLMLATMREDAFEFDEVRVKDVFEEAKEGLRPSWEGKQLTLDICCKDETVFAERTLLASLFTNLVENAVKACREGGKIRLEARGQEDFMVLSVIDNGRGMTQDELAHITEAFYRADKARSREEGGAGLGLSLCEQIAQIHAAKLEFSSKPGMGTRVNCTFTKP